MFETDKSKYIIHINLPAGAQSMEILSEDQIVYFGFVYNFYSHLLNIEHFELNIRKQCNIKNRLLIRLVDLSKIHRTQFDIRTGTICRLDILKSII